MSNEQKDIARLVKLHKNKIYLTENYRVELANTNLPPQVLNKILPENIWWEVRVVQYENHILTIAVVDYFVKDSSVFFLQKHLIKNRVDQIVFTNLQDTDTIIASIKYSHREQKRVSEQLEASNKGNPQLSISPFTDEMCRSIHKSFNIPFSEATFKLGYVSFEKNISELARMVQFQVANSFIRDEFDHVKYFFAKELGKKSFAVEVEIKANNYDIEDIMVRSADIDRINEQMIETVKHFRTLELTKPPKVEVDKTLFTEEDIFDHLGEEGLGNIFEQNEDDILKILMGAAHIRNARQLAYLAGQLHKKGEKIRFTLGKQFGFLFFVVGAEMNHFCWELLNSNATYIWSFSKGAMSKQLQYRRIAEQINLIQDQGRQSYKSKLADVHLDEALAFHIVRHEHINSALKDGFVKWKHALNEQLV